MADCKIIYKNGIPMGVEDSSGNFSKIFQSILSNPHLNFDSAINVYSYFKGKYPDLETAEYNLEYRTPNGNSYNRFQEALINTQEGNIELLLGEQVGATIDVNSNSKNMTGMINYLVRQDLVTGDTFQDTDGQKVFITRGNTEEKKAISADLAREHAFQYHGKRVITIGEDFNIKLQEVSNIPSGSLGTLSKEMGEEMAVFVKTIEEVKLSSNTGANIDIQVLANNELEEKLLNLLGKMGVKTTSIEEWSRRYNAKNDTYPDVKALADLANNIIAFKDGIISQGDLTEETSHFIIASLESSQKENMKRNIHRTKEWAQFSETYFNLYGQQSEDQVREEILGKVLANSLQDNFQRASQQNLEGGIISTLRNLVAEFFTRVSNFFQPNFQAELDMFTFQVYTNLMNDSLDIDVRNKQNNNYILYSANTSSGLAKQLQKVYQTLLNQQTVLEKKYRLSSGRNTLSGLREKLSKETDSAGVRASIAQLLAVTTSQLNILTRSMNSAQEGQRHFSQEENSVYQSVIQRLSPMIDQVKVSLNEKEDSLLLEEIAKVQSKISDIRGRVPDNNRQALNFIVERVIKKNNMTQEQADKYREYISNIVETAQKDTAWIHAHLGGLIAAQNGLLNLAGETIERIQYRETELYQPKIKSFLNSLSKIGFNPQELNRFIYKGKLINEVDPEKVEVLDRQDKAQILSVILNENITEESVEEKITSMTNKMDSLIKEMESVDISTQEFRKIEEQKDEIAGQLSDLNRQFKQIKSQRLESYFAPEFLKEQQEFSLEINGITISRENISDDALALDRMWRSQLAEVRKMGTLTASDLAEIKNLNRQRTQASSSRKPDGTLKKGVIEVYDYNLNTMIYTLDVDNIDNLSSSEFREAEQVIGLQQLSLLSSQFWKTKSGDTNGIPQKFIDELNNFQTEQEKLDFLYNNAYVNFPQSFWDSFDPNASLTVRLLEEGSDEALQLVEDIRQQQTIIKNLLKINKDVTNPAEIVTSGEFGMSLAEKTSIREAQSVLETKNAQARAILEETEQISLTDYTTNRAYENDKQDLGVDSVSKEIDFILGRNSFRTSHTTANGAESIISLKRSIDKLKRGEAVAMSKFLTNIVGERTDYDNILLEYARTKLLPYYRRTEPIGFSEIQNQFLQNVENNVENSVLDYIESGVVQVNPNWSFYESSERINPKWQENKDKGREQYTQEYLNKVRNDEYYSRFNINPLTREPSSQSKDWQAYKLLLELQDWTIDNYGLTGIQDRYQLPQMRKSVVRRFTDSGDKKRAIKDIVTDYTGIREDETEFGQDALGNAVKKGDSLLTIPMYGVNRISEQEDITDELLLSYGWMAQQSALYRARREGINDMLTLEDFILQGEYSNKSARATNTYKMFKSFLDANFYGVKETLNFELSYGKRKINIGKLARVFNSWVRFSGLAGVTVPLTSALQGKVQEFIERNVSEVTNPIAYNLAHNKFLKWASQSAADTMKLSSGSDLNVLMETFGVSDPTDRFDNVSLSRTNRAILKTNSGLHMLGNFPVIPTTFLSVLTDYRIVGDKILTLKQYKQVDKQGSDEDWKKLPLFIDMLPVKDGVTTRNYKEIERLTGLQEEQVVDMVNITMEAISARSKGAVQRIDSQIPEYQKSIAARDARTNFFLMFMNWFLVAIPNKIKHRHYNLAEGAIEQEGNWLTIVNMLRDMAVNPKEIKKVWKESLGDEVKLRNLKRTAIELATANVLAVAAVLLANLVDDFDDEEAPYVLAWADYMLTRVAVEQVSGTVALPLQLSKTLSDPLVAKKRLLDLFNIHKLVTGDEIVQRGSYANETERYKWAAQNLPFIKDYHKFKDFESARDTYFYFNQTQDKTLSQWAWMSNLVMEE